MQHDQFLANFAAKARLIRIAHQRRFWPETAGKRLVAGLPGDLSSDEVAVQASKQLFAIKSEVRK